MPAKTPFVPLILLLVAGISTGCGQSLAVEEPGPVRLVVRRGDFQRRVVLNGEVEAKRGVSITVPKMPGWETTIKWIAEDGAAMRKGERVAELDNTSFSGSLAQNRIALTEATQQLAQHDARTSSELEEKRFEVERRRLVLEGAKVAATVPESILARREYQDRQLELRRATIEHEKAIELFESGSKAATAQRENLLLSITTAQREIAVAEGAIEDLVIVAPTDGVLIVGELPWEARKLQIGDRVWVGFPIAFLPDLSSLQVTADLWDVDDGKLTAGEKVEVTIDAYPGVVFGGSITAIAPVAQESNRQSLRRSFRTVIALDRIDSAMMRPGFSAKVTATRNRTRNALLIPRGCLLRDGKGAYVKIASGERTVVTLGPCNAQECVVEGLAEGTELQQPVRQATASKGA